MFMNKTGTCILFEKGEYGILYYPSKCNLNSWKDSEFQKVHNADKLTSGGPLNIISINGGDYKFSVNKSYK